MQGKYGAGSGTDRGGRREDSTRPDRPLYRRLRAVIRIASFSRSMRKPPHTVYSLGRELASEDARASGAKEDGPVSKLVRAAESSASATPRSSDRELDSSTRLGHCPKSRQRRGCVDAAVKQRRENGAAPRQSASAGNLAARGNTCRRTLRPGPMCSQRGDDTRQYGSDSRTLRAARFLPSPHELKRRVQSTDSVFCYFLQTS